MREISLDFLHALAHMDHSVFSLVRVLFIRPGYVAREYVDGKRKRYFGPFAFLVIVVGLSGNPHGWKGSGVAKGTHQTGHERLGNISHRVAGWVAVLI
jgi:hypothetical protein